MNTKAFLLAGIGLLTAGVAVAQQKPAEQTQTIDWKKLTNKEWRQRLSSNQYYILRQAGTEPPFSNAYHNNHKVGTYQCAGCALELFSSEQKFDSGTGWPSFWQPIKKGATLDKRDPDGERVEVLCSRCLGHLGHVFNDATGEYGIQKTPTGLRYCMNSGAMKFVPKSAPK